MNNKNAIEILLNIECSCDVNGISVNNIKLWPLIRLNLWWLLTLEKEVSDVKDEVKSEENNDNSIISEIIYSTKKIAENLAWIYRQFYHVILLKLIPVKHNNTLFIYYDDERYFDNGLNLKNKHLDPLAEFAAESGYQPCKITLKRTGKSSSIKYCRNSETLEFNILAIVRNHFRYEINKIKKGIIGLNIIDDINSHLPDNVSLNKDNFVYQVISFQSYLEYFKKMISKIKPEAVFFTCYYRIETMAIICASKLLQIKSVDVQHGKQGKYHGLYNNWSKLPKEGYELLPDYFWNWGQEAKENIQQTRPAEYPHHKPVVGGNIWLNNILSKNQLNKLPNQLERKINKYSKIILVTLQPIENPLFYILMRAMQVAPKDWIWLVRLHPSQINIMAEIKNKIESTGKINYEIELSSNVSLYDLLRCVDYHITGWSSVSIEALLFKVPTVFVDEQGYDIYQDKISSRMFWYAPTPEDLINLVNGDKLKVNKNSYKEYFNIDTERTKEVFRSIVNHAYK